jgi:hypothetical protein
MKAISPEALRVVAAVMRQVKAMQVAKEWMKLEARWAIGQ